MNIERNNQKMVFITGDIYWPLLTTVMSSNFCYWLSKNTRVRVDVSISGIQQQQQQTESMPSSTTDATSAIGDFLW